MTSNDPLPLPTHWNVGFNNSRPLTSYSLYALNELRVQHRRGESLTQPDGMDQALTNEINRRETSQGYLARRRGPRRADDKANGQKIQKLQEDIVGLEKSGSIDSESIRRLQDTLRCKVQEIESLCKTVGTLRSQRNGAQSVLKAHHIDTQNFFVEPFIGDVKPTAVRIDGRRFVDEEELKSSLKAKKLPNLPAAWKTATGRKIPITQLEDHHLDNIIKGNFTSKDPLMEEAILREKLRRASKTISRRINTLFNKRVNGSKRNEDVAPAAYDPRLTQIGLDIASGKIKEVTLDGPFDDYAKNPDNYARTEEFDEDGMLTISIVHKESPQYRAALDIIDRRMSEEAGGGKTGFATGGIVKRCPHDFTKHRPNPFSPNFVMGEEVPSVEMVNKLAEQGTKKFNQLQAQVESQQAKTEALTEAVNAATEGVINLQTFVEASMGGLGREIGKERDKIKTLDSEIMDVAGQRKDTHVLFAHQLKCLETLVGPGWKTAEGYVRSIFQLSTNHLENIIVGDFGSDEIRTQIDHELERRLIDDQHQDEDNAKEAYGDVNVHKLQEELEGACGDMLKKIKRALGGK